MRRYVGVGFLRRADVTVHRGWASLAGSPDLPTVESSSLLCRRLSPAAWPPLCQRKVNEFLCSRACGSPDIPVYCILSSSLSDWIIGLSPRSPPTIVGHMGENHPVMHLRPMQFVTVLTDYLLTNLSEF